jgi:hypothetical protein
MQKSSCTFSSWNADDSFTIRLEILSQHAMLAYKTELLCKINQVKLHRPHFLSTLCRNDTVGCNMVSLNKLVCIISIWRRHNSVFLWQILVIKINKCYKNDAQEKYVVIWVMITCCSLVRWIPAFQNNILPPFWLLLEELCSFTMLVPTYQIATW